MPDRQLTLRLISAAILGPAVLLSIWFGGWFYFGLIMISAVLCAWEWAKMSVPRLRHTTVIIQAGSILLGVILGQMGAFGLAFWCIVAGAAFAALVAVIKRGGIADVAFGVIYVGVPHVCALWLRQAPDGQLLVMLVVLAIWATDSAAYVAGRMVGGAKLAPAVSPNKTWSGAIGGAVAAMATGVAFHFVFAPHHGILALLVLGLILSVASQFGDLFESLMKREFGTKDAGGLIPGHGGLLDRIDGLMAAMVVATGILTFLPVLWSQG